MSGQTHALVRPCSLLLMEMVALPRWYKKNGLCVEFFAYTRQRSLAQKKAFVKGFLAFLG